ncbi:MAG: ATP-binding protein [Tannerellaceae bacterium]|nr:ATP-binding protein [Tannerellaceae bacterium]
MVTWINASQKEDKNVIFLSGTAGCGKTTLLRDLCMELKRLEIPVLGLKSDVYPVEDLEKLRLKLNLKYAVTDVLKEIARHTNVVLLIDQIDALSQYLSGKREFIYTYQHLIESFTNYPGVKL